MAVYSSTCIYKAIQQFRTNALLDTSQLKARRHYFKHLIYLPQRGLKGIIEASTQDGNWTEALKLCGAEWRELLPDEIVLAVDLRAIRSDQAPSWVPILSKVSSMIPFIICLHHLRHRWQRTRLCKVLWAGR